MRTGVRNHPGVLTGKWGTPAASCLAVAALFAAPLTASAQDHAVDLRALNSDLTKETPDPDAVTSVVWMPPEFWKVTLALNDMSPEEVDEFVTVLKPYTMILAVDGTIGMFGGITFVPHEEVLASVRLVADDGLSYEPLADSEVDADMQSFLSMFMPVFSQSLGEYGENMFPVLFPGTSEDGSRLADPLTEGTFTVRVGERRFGWRTPLGSLLPPKYCPIDGEKLSGAWRYCPWHGAELSDGP